MTLDDLLPGLRLAAFEILDFAVPDLRRLYLREMSDGSLEIVPEWKGEPEENDRAALKQLFENVIEVAFEDEHAPPPVVVAVKRDAGFAYHELLSPELHDRIASRVAPHRKGGR